MSSIKSNFNQESPKNDSCEKPYLSDKYFSAVNLNVDDNEPETISRSSSYSTIKGESSAVGISKGVQSLMKITDETRVELEEFKNRIRSLQQQLDYYMNIKERDDDTIMKQATEIQLLRKQCANFSAQVEDLSRENGKLVKESSCSNVEITMSKMEIDKLSKRFREEVQMINETIYQYEEDIQFKDGLIKSLKNELVELCNDLRHAREAVSQKELLYARSEEEIGRLTELLSKFSPNNPVGKENEAVYEILQQELHTNNQSSFQKLVKKLKFTKKKLETSKRLNGKLQLKH